jgi:ubiquinone/menaquinone biosynthesis C-methylase UbiE
MIENNELAKYYDLLYHDLDYRGSSLRIGKLVEKYSPKGGNMLLDVACGTGTNISFLKSKFQCTGIDISPAMIEEAKKKTNDVEFIVDDMRTFFLPRKFNILTCLFNSLNYLKNTAELEKTMNNFYSHLDAEGIMMTECLQKDNMIFSRQHVLRSYDGENVKIVRMSDLKSADTHAIFDFHYLISEKGTDTKYLNDTIALTLFSKREIIDMMKKAGFNVKHLKKGFYGQGLFIGLKK